MEYKDVFLENQREYYYEAISKLTNKEDIIKELPTPEYKNFFILILGIQERLEKDKKQWQEMLKSIDNNSEDYEYIKEELELCDFKIKICTSLYQDTKETLEEEEEFQKTERKNLIFATTSSGNIYLEKDLKYISEEYYEVILRNLQKIEQGYQEENPEKAKAYTSTNLKLSGMHVAKDFKIRVFYKILDKDTAYVFLARMKKDNFETLDREEPIERAKQTNKEYLKLKKLLKDDKEKQTLIKKNRIIKEQLYNRLTSEKRGRTNDR